MRSKTPTLIRGNTVLIRLASLPIRFIYFAQGLVDPVIGVCYISMKKKFGERIYMKSTIKMELVKQPFFPFSRPAASGLRVFSRVPFLLISNHLKKWEKIEILGNYTANTNRFFKTCRVPVALSV